MVARPRQFYSLNIMMCFLLILAELMRDKKTATNEVSKIVHLKFAIF